MDTDKQPEQKMVPTSAMTFSGGTFDPLDLPDYTPKPENKVTIGKTAAMRNDWYDSVYDHLRQQPNRTTETRQLMRDLGKQKKQTTPGPGGAKVNILADDDLERVFPQELPRQLAARAAIATNRPLDQTSREVRDGYIRHVNHKPWETIQHDIVEPRGQKLTSTIDPVNASYHENYAGYGQTGLGSMSGRLTPDQRTPEEKTRPVNLWQTSLERDDKTLFQAYRSGAFVDNANDPVEREQNAQAKARGVLEAALIDRLRAMPEARRQEYLSGKKAYDGTMVSIDLLSATGADSALAADHHRTLRGLDGKQQGYNITWDGQQHDVKAQFEILDFMAGVNGMNVKAGPIPNILGSNSSDQADYNAASWKRLRQKADFASQYYSKAQGDTAHDLGSNISALTKGIDGDLGRSGDYQLPAMLANLAHELGTDVHFNCKSGKDRTGIMDSESKFMARQLDKNPGMVPDVSNPKHRGIEQNYEHEQMLWESGSLDVLAQNVGGQCLKTADLATVAGVSKLPTTDKKLMKNLGGKEKLAELAGLKRYADIDTIATFEQKNWKQQVEPMSDERKAAYEAEARAYLTGLPPLGPTPQAPPKPRAHGQQVAPQLPPQQVVQPLLPPVVNDAQPQPQNKALPPIPVRAQQPVQQNLVQPLLPDLVQPGDIDQHAPLVRPQPRPRGVPQGAFQLPGF